MTSLNDIRSTFLDYFGSNRHEVVASSPLVPRNDPTLMFTNAGMVQFKNVFTGIETRPYSRAVTSQKCVRAGGKHNDLDNVGYTARHHTFFEMLGNFSFGDYFKERAIELAWELVTTNFGLNKDKLLVTVHQTDEEAASLWRKIAGLPEDRIIRIDSDDNWWRMGDTGPNGPCTEIFFDHGDHIWGGPPGSAEEDGDRFIEIWNLVFMQFETFPDGSSKSLPAPSVDTGMGLERIGALLQGKHDNYDTDLMRTLIEASAGLTDGSPDGDGRIHHRVIADHLRATSFLIADGVLPSNEGRGYVLRRIMRRAMRHAHLLGATDPVMHRLVPSLVAQMGQAFPELSMAQGLIEETLELEEKRFKTTLDRGLRLLDAELEGLPEGAALPGETAFRLYDTFGFPLDLTQDALRERDRTVETEGFDAAMAEQKAIARAAWKGSGEAADEAIWFDIADTHGATEFLGYDTEIAEGQILAIVKDGKPAQSAGAGEECWLVLNQTPFYGESGGQVGDEGEITTDNGSALVTDVQKRQGVFAHHAKVRTGVLEVGSAGAMKVDHMRRAAIRANHSGTHLLHEALRGALGDHVAQRGSLVAPDRLRFDFQHQKAMNIDEIRAVEREVNAYVRQNAEVTTRLMTPDEAQGIGARALFGEKYGDEVRVVAMGSRPDDAQGPAGDVYSMELCGGTHVARTGEIGLLVITGESASSAGVRRVEALTGEAAYEYLSAQDSHLAEAASALKARPEEVAGRIRAMMDERRKMESELAELRRQVALGGGGTDAGSHADEINGIPFLAQVLPGISPKDLRGLIDEHKSRLGSGVVLLIADTDGKAAVAAGVTEELVGRVSAVDLVRAAVSELGGKGGGGRPDFAQGGGPDASGAHAAVAAAKSALEAVPA